MKKIITILAIVLLVGGSMGAAGFFFVKHRNLKRDYTALKNENDQLKQATAGTQKSADQELKEITEEIGKIVELPKDETPSLATVQDKEKLKDQVFFAKAENGDKLLIYSKTKTAYLWRPSTKKLINVGPITITQGAETPSTTTPAQP